MLVVWEMAHSPTTFTVSDSLHQAWLSLPRVANTNGDCGGADSVQFFYAVATTTGQVIISNVDNDSDENGMLVAEYSGVAPAVDASSSKFPSVASQATTTGALTTTHETLIVAAMLDDNGGGVMTFDANEVKTRGIDDFAYGIIGDNSPGANAGTFTVTGTIPNAADDCWVAEAVAFRLL